MTTSASSPRVWVVDDSALEAEMSRRALAATCQVDVFSDGPTLLERLAAGRRPDVLVVDWQMPVMSGLELCQFVRQSHDASDLPLIILTATRHREDLLAALAAGANDYVMKPFDSEELAARVATAVQTRRSHSMLQSAAEFRERFIGILGHDLRQPLGTLSIGTSVLMTHDLPEGDAKTVRRLFAATQRMSRMIADLLDLTRTRLGGGIPVDRRPMDLNDACREVVEEVQMANPERVIELRAAADGRGAWDRDRLQQVCTNLIGNAIQYGDASAPIIVRVSGDEHDVTLVVENAGAAIPPAVQATLFDPFRRGTNEASAARGQGGLGLGLFIVQQIAQQHDGSITVESDEVRTAFSVRMPRHPARPV